MGSREITHQEAQRDLFYRAEMIKGIGSSHQRCVFIGEFDKVLIRMNTSHF